MTVSLLFTAGHIKSINRQSPTESVSGQWLLKYGFNTSEGFSTGFVCVEGWEWGHKAEHESPVLENKGGNSCLKIELFRPP